MDRCEECGFVYDEVSTDDVPAALRSLGPRYRDRLVDAAGSDNRLARVRAHPLEGVWSALEYGCHVRDMLQVQQGRLALALAEDCPEFTPMGRDERVIADRYNEQDPTVVTTQLEEAAETLAGAFAPLDEDQWQRVAIYHWPVTAERTMAWVARHTVHEGEHHLMDIDRLLEKTQILHGPL